MRDSCLQPISRDRAGSAGRRRVSEDGTGTPEGTEWKSSPCPVLVPNPEPSGTGAIWSSDHSSARQVEMARAAPPSAPQASPRRLQGLEMWLLWSLSPHPMLRPVSLLLWQFSWQHLALGCGTSGELCWQSQPRPADTFNPGGRELPYSKRDRQTDRQRRQEQNVILSGSVRPAGWCWGVSKSGDCQREAAVCPCPTCPGTGREASWQRLVPAPPAWALG